MWIHTESRKNNLIAISLLLMLACLFISRAALSISMFLFLGLTLVHKDFPNQCKNFFSNFFLLSVSLLFFIPFVSFFWSADKTEWGEIMRIKIPLLFFPLAFAGSWKLKQQQWIILAFAFLGLMFLGCAWSLSHYFSDAAAFNEAYLRSKTLATPLEDDHLRFGWLAALAVLLCFLLIDMKSSSGIVLIGLAIFFTIYIHILSARMGLFSLYLIFLLTGTWFVFKTKRKKLIPAFVSVLLLLPLLAWFLFPTFRNRISYIMYDFSLVREQGFVSGSNDGTRIQSLKAGWDILQENSFGVGAGDLKKTMYTWYDIHLPQMQDFEKFLPCSEWLVYGGFAGWPAVLMLTMIMGLPFFMKRGRYRIYWIALHSMVVFSFAFDMTIEAQFGVFIYAFSVLWWWKWLFLKTENEK